MSHLEALIRREAAPEPGPAAPGRGQAWLGLRPWVGPFARRLGTALPAASTADALAETGPAETVRADPAREPADEVRGEAPPSEAVGPVEPPARPRPVAPRPPLPAAVSQPVARDVGAEPELLLGEEDARGPFRPPAVVPGQRGTRSEPQPRRSDEPGEPSRPPAHPARPPLPPHASGRPINPGVGGRAPAPRAADALAPPAPTDEDLGAFAEDEPSPGAEAAPPLPPAGESGQRPEAGLRARPTSSLARRAEVGRRPGSVEPATLDGPAVLFADGQDTDRSGGPTVEAGPAPEPVRVSIGRVEVRAVVEPRAARGPREGARPPSPLTGLSDYLDRRAREGR